MAIDNSSYREEWINSGRCQQQLQRRVDTEETEREVSKSKILLQTLPKVFGLYNSIFKIFTENFEEQMIKTLRERKREEKENRQYTSWELLKEAIPEFGNEIWKIKTLLSFRVKDIFENFEK